MSAGFVQVELVEFDLSQRVPGVSLIWVGWVGGFCLLGFGLGNQSGWKWAFRKFSRFGNV
jgi:hypothetical protein